GLVALNIYPGFLDNIWCNINTSCVKTQKTVTAPTPSNPVLELDAEVVSQQSPLNSANAKNTNTPPESPVSIPVEKPVPKEPISADAKPGPGGLHTQVTEPAKGAAVIDKRSVLQGPPGARGKAVAPDPDQADVTILSDFTKTDTNM